MTTPFDPNKQYDPNAIGSADPSWSNPKSLVQQQHDDYMRALHAQGAPSFQITSTGTKPPPPPPPGGISAPSPGGMVGIPSPYSDPPPGAIFSPEAMKRLLAGEIVHVAIPDPAHPGVTSLRADSLMLSGCTCKWCVRIRKELLCAVTTDKPEKRAKPIHEMTFADYQKGVDAWWPNRRKS